MATAINRENKFVVYAFSREKDSKTGLKGTYYYIGKGKPERPYTCGNRKTVKCPKDRKNNIHILHSNLEEEIAFDYEKRLIEFYGRIDTMEGWCVLRNRTGGGEGASGTKMSEKRRKEISGKNSRFYNPRVWSHPRHGLVYKKSISDLLKEYPEEKLLQSGLSQLACKKLHSYKSWVLVSEEEIPLELSSEELNRKFGVDYAKSRLKEIKRRITGSNNHKYISRDWCHPEHGLVLDASIFELIREFPLDELSASCLSSIARGKKDNHKGWIFIDNGLINKSLAKEELEKIFSKEYARCRIEEMRKIRKSNRKKNHQKLDPLF